MDLDQYWWWTCSSKTYSMLSFITADDLARKMCGVSDRKLRCICHAYLRDSWANLHVPSRQLVAASEMLCDALSTEQYKAAIQSIIDADRNMPSLREDGIRFRGQDISGFASEEARDLTISGLSTVSVMTQAPMSLPEPRACHLMRVVIGDPFDPLKVNPEWMTEEVLSLGYDAYSHRDYGNIGTDSTAMQMICDRTRLSIFADALEDAGCTDERIIRSLRGEWPVPHFKKSCIWQMPGVCPTCETLVPSDAPGSYRCRCGTEVECYQPMFAVPGRYEYHRFQDQIQGWYVLDQLLKIDEVVTDVMKKSENRYIMEALGRI